MSTAETRASNHRGTASEQATTAEEAQEQHRWDACGTSGRSGRYVRLRQEPRWKDVGIVSNHSGNSFRISNHIEWQQKATKGPAAVGAFTTGAVMAGVAKVGVATLG